MHPESKNPAECFISALACFHQLRTVRICSRTLQFIDSMLSVQSTEGLKLQLGTRSIPGFPGAKGGGRFVSMAQIRKVHAIDDRSLLDRVAVLALNNAHAKQTSTLDETSLAELLEMAFYAPRHRPWSNCLPDRTRSECSLSESQLQLVQAVSRVVRLH